MRGVIARAGVVAIASVAAQCHRQPPPAAPTTPVGTDAIAALKVDLVRSIERDAGSVANECTRGGLWLAVVRHGAPDERERARRTLQELIAKSLSSGDPICLVRVAADLLPQLPDAERAATVETIVRRMERGDAGYASLNEWLQSMAPALDAGQASRIERVARHAGTHCCVRSIVLSHLARVGRVALTDAVEATKSCPEHCQEIGQSPLLPLADRATRDALLSSELRELATADFESDSSPLYLLAMIAPHLEASRRHDLMARAFRAMPVLGVKDGNQWGELPPEFHFWAELTKLAPFVTADLVDPALHSAPPSWPAETRAFLVGTVADGLPPELRRKNKNLILAAIPGPAGSREALRARMMMAPDMAIDDVRQSLDRFLALEPKVDGRVEMIARIVTVLPAPDRPALCARLLRDIQSLPTPDSRSRAASAVLDQLAGISPH